MLAPAFRRGSGPISPRIRLSSRQTRLRQELLLRAATRQLEKKRPTTPSILDFRPSLTSTMPHTRNISNSSSSIATSTNLHPPLSPPPPAPTQRRSSRQAIKQMKQAETRQEMPGSEKPETPDDSVKPEESSRKLKHPENPENPENPVVKSEQSEIPVQSVRPVKLEIQGNSTHQVRVSTMQARIKIEAENDDTRKAEDDDDDDIAHDAVSLAVADLDRLERDLRRATKRQKIQVQETSFPAQVGGGTGLNSARRLRSAESGSTRSTGGRWNGADGSPSAFPGGPGMRSGFGEDTSDAAQRGASRSPAVNSSYLPLPWKGRLGYACLNTYLRTARPPVFCSRTCRMSSIIQHRFPLQHPSLPEHITRNRPDRTKRSSVELGRRYVQNLGLANARDIVKMLCWNEKYNIKFLRLSSDMFPFASHWEHGYNLAPIASGVLAEAGKVAADFGHRITTHPGQYTQLGSPRLEVIAASVRDLEYHDEMLSLLRLPEQQNRDAVIVLHIGGVFGDKASTLNRFRINYATRLSPSIKARLVLENDDVSWSVHDLLPLCEELNIPLVLDFHHHNIIFDSTKVREGTLDITEPALAGRIAATWRRKGITQKMHYSEPCTGAFTPRDRRRHSARVTTLPPCPPDMDLMIEAKDKEQAVFELMRTFRLPGFERINDIIPYERDDECRSPGGACGHRQKQSKNGDGDGSGDKKRKSDPATPSDSDADDSSFESDDDVPGYELGRGNYSSVSFEEFAMGGPQSRVYWPPGMEEWLKPRKEKMR